MSSESSGAHWALEATTDNVILIDRDFRITFINRATAALNNITPESVVGRSIWEVWPGNLNTDIERNYRRAMSQGVPVRFVHGYFEPGKFDLWLEIQAYPSPDGLAIFFHDVSDLKRQEESQERLDSAIRATDLGVWRCELPIDDKPFYWSPQVRRHFGISADEEVGVEQFLELLHPDDRAPTAEAMTRAIENRVPYDVVYRTLGRDGKIRWIRATGNAFYRDDGTPYRFDGFTVEVTDRVETERELRAAKARIDATFASADVGTWVLDVPNDRINGDANLARLFGMDLEEAKVGTAAEYIAKIHPSDRGPVAEALGRSLTEGTPYDIEYRVLTGGRERWLVARGLPEFNEDGRIVSLPGVVVDITVLKAAQARERAALETVRATERRQSLRIELVDALRNLHDAESITIAASEVVGRFFGASRAYYVDVDPKGETFEVMRGWPGDEPRILGRFNYDAFGRGLINEIAKGDTVAVEDTETHPLTKDRYAVAYAPAALRSFLVVPRLRDGQMVGMFAVNDRVPRRWQDEEVGLMEDLADRVWGAIERARAESDLRSLNASLDEIVQRRTEELTRANEEAEAFNYSIAHDLRSPLRAINATSRILLDDLGDAIDPEQKALLQRQAHNAKRLGELIDALLSLSRLARQPLECQDFDLTALAHEVAQALSCEVEIAEGLHANADPRLVRLVLQNLLENAHKFSPKGGTIRVGQTDGAFYVQDQGVGFDMAFAPKIFQPFERLVSEEEFPGTGIGLANVDRIVRRHGGRVWAESERGKGATFYFTLG